MPSLEALKPHDIVVALQLTASPDATFESLSKGLSISTSTAHASVGRLQVAGLLRPETRQVNRRALLEFLEYGIRYAFPARLDVLTRGVPTAHSGPVLAPEIVADDAIVWPSVDGPTVGASIAPLYPAADQLPRTSPSVYELLTLVDAIRVGRIRERTRAIEHLRRRLGAESQAA